MKNITEAQILQRLQDLAGTLINVSADEAIIKRSVQKIYYDNVSSENLQIKMKHIDVSNSDVCIPLPCDVYRVLRFLYNGQVVNLRTNMRNELILDNRLMRVKTKEQIITIIYRAMEYEYDEFGEPTELIYPFEALDMLVYGFIVQYLKTHSLTNPDKIQILPVYEDYFEAAKGVYKGSFVRRTITQIEEITHVLRTGDKFGHNR